MYSHDCNRNGKKGLENVAILLKYLVETVDNMEICIWVDGFIVQFMST